MFGVQTLSTHKSLAAKLSSVYFTCVCILFPHFKVMMQKKLNQQITFSLTHGLLAQKEGMASFLSLSKEISHLKVHNNGSVYYT